MFDNQKNHEDGSEPIPHISVRNNDRVDVDLDTFSEEVSQPAKEKGIAGLVLLALLEAAAIAAIVAYWMAVL